MRKILIIAVVIFLSVQIKSYSQLISGASFGLRVDVSSDSINYFSIDKFFKIYKGQLKFEDIVSYSHEYFDRKSNAIYNFTTIIENKEISIYFFIPLDLIDCSKNKTVIAKFNFDISQLKSGTYFVNYYNELCQNPKSFIMAHYDDISIQITIPSKTLKSHKISNSILSKEYIEDILSNRKKIIIVK